MERSLTDSGERRLIVPGGWCRGVKFFLWELACFHIPTVCDNASRIKAFPPERSMHYYYSYICMCQAWLLARR